MNLFALVVTAALDDLGSEASRCLANSPSFSRSYTDSMGVASATNTVLNLDIDLWDDVLIIDTGLGEITSGGSINHVADIESLNSLILRDASEAVVTTHRLDSTATASVLTTVSSLLGHTALKLGYAGGHDPKFLRPRATFY